MPIAMLLAALLCFVPAAADAAPGLFERMAGAWSGGGRIEFSNGQSERIRCRATYAPESGGALLEQHLRCASDSYNFNIESMVASHRGSLTGDWTESTHNVAGQIVGTISNNEIRAHVRAAQFNAALSLSVIGKSLRLALVPQAGNVGEIEVALRRA